MPKLRQPVVVVPPVVDPEDASVNWPPLLAVLPELPDPRGIFVDPHAHMAHVRVAEAAREAVLDARRRWIIENHRP